MSKARVGLALLLLVSFGLRLVLAARGGQQYWPDEDRYISARNAVGHFFRSEWTDIARELLGNADHILFRWVGLPCALMEYFTGPSPALAAAYWSMFSVLIILLVWMLALRMQATEGEALLAAFLAACANSLFYYARHYFPYDASLLLLLIAYWIGLDRAAKSGIFISGVIVGLGFLTYNGHWQTGAAILGILVARERSGRVKAAVLAGIGLSISIAQAVLMSRLAGYDLIALWQKSAGTITQGDFGIGWRIVLEYFWHTEGLLCVMWGLAISVGLAWWWKWRDQALACWLWPSILIFVALVILSDLLPKFVVYGRLTRTLVPFFCLMTARVITMGAAKTAWFAPARWTVTGVAALSAFWHMAEPLRQEFPAQFEQRVIREIATRQLTQTGIYQVMNARHLWGVDLVRSLPPHDEVMRSAHPLQFRPYQYEGYSVAQREELKNGDPAMKLIRLKGMKLGLMPEDRREPHLGPLRMHVRFSQLSPGRSEPLITTGKAQKGDFLYVIYHDAGHIRIGHDHWGSGGSISEPIAIDYNQVHELLVSIGPLLPPDGHPDQQRYPGVAVLRQWLLVVLNGVTVFSAPASWFPSSPAEVVIGNNLIGGSSTQAFFSGVFAGVERIPTTELASRLPALAMEVVQRDPEWMAAKGPWRMKVDLRNTPVGRRQPLLTSRTEGGVEALVLEKSSPAAARIGYERLGAETLWSEVFPVQEPTANEVTLSFGSLFPPTESRVYQTNPGWSRMRQLTYAAWNGRTVLLRHVQPVQGRSGEAALARRVDQRLSLPPFFEGMVWDARPESPDLIVKRGVQLAEQIQSRGDLWQGYTGPIALRVRLPLVMPAETVTEPLLAAGVSGEGDFLYIRYGSDGLVRFGYDHWGASGPPESAPLKWEPGQEYQILVSAGFLLPPPAAPLYSHEPHWLAWRDRVIVVSEGRRVLDAKTKSHPTATSQVTLGVNFIGGSTTRSDFRGIIEVSRLAAPEEFLR